MSSKVVHNFSVFLSVNLPTRSKLREGGYKLSFDLNVFYFLLLLLFVLFLCLARKKNHNIVRRQPAAELTRQY